MFEKLVWIVVYYCKLVNYIDLELIEYVIVLSIRKGNFVVFSGHVLE